MIRRKQTGPDAGNNRDAEVSPGGMAQIGALAGGIAHDLNTVITTIYGYSEQALESIGDANSGAANSIKKIIGAADRARMLTGQLMALSRHAAEEKVPVRVVAVLAEAIDFITPSVPPGVRIIRSLNAPDATVTAVPAQLFRIFMNLLLNAAQAISDAEGTISVSTDWPFNREGIKDEENGNRIQIRIMDSGKGMDAETASRIFDPWFTSGRQNGTGLGLTVVSDAVREMGGTIAVASEIGRGTCFDLLIPVTPLGSLR